MEQKYTSGNLRDFFRVIFKYRRRILFVFFGIVAVVTAATFLMPPVYEAKSTVMVKFGRELIYRPELGDGRPSVLLNQDSLINTEIQILTSRDLIQKVISTIGLDEIYGTNKFRSIPSGTTPMEAAILQFEKSLVIENKPRSDVIQISFSHSDPRTAARAVNLLVDFFKEKHLQVFSGPTTPFLERQLMIYEQKLRDSEKKLETFKQTHGVFSMDEQKGLLLRQRTELDTAFKHSQNQIRELQQMLASVKEKGTLNAERQAVIDNTKNQLLTLRLKEQDLLRKYKENSRTVGNVREEIRVVGEFLENQKADFSKSEIAKIEADLNAQKARSASLSRQIFRLDNDIRMLDSRERELQGLKRDLAINDGNYQTYLKKLEEARISDEMDSQKIANISVIQAAAAPAKPVKPKKEYNILLSILVGAVSGLGIAFLSEYSSQG
ncbi:MAG: GumC family protein, partial [Syntrophales bacterium]